MPFSVPILASILVRLNIEPVLECIDLGATIQERPRNRLTPKLASHQQRRPPARADRVHFRPRVVEDCQDHLLPVLPDRKLQSAHPTIVPASNVRPALEEHCDDCSVPSVRRGHERRHASIVGLVDQLRRVVEERLKLIDPPKLRRLHVRRDSEHASH